MNSTKPKRTFASVTAEVLRVLRPVETHKGLCAAIAGLQKDARYRVGDLNFDLLCELLQERLPESDPKAKRIAAIVSGQLDDELFDVASSSSSDEETGSE